MSRLDLYCSVAAFWPPFGRALSRGGNANSAPQDSAAVAAQRAFKGFSTQHVQVHLRQEFPGVLSYSHFVELMPRFLVPLAIYLHTQLGQCSGISFIDSTARAVCHPPRIHQHRVFAVDARRSKTSVGWFYGFKLHLVVNDCGELLAFCRTPGNTDDRRPVPRLVRRLFGKLFGDKSYLSQALAEELLITHGLQLVTKARKNMRGRVLRLVDKLLLRKRAIIESVNDQLKNVCQIEHARHRCPTNFLIHLLADLVAYCHQPKKPSLHLDRGLLSLPAT